MARPDFSEISSGAEFYRWYWLKDEMVDICKLLSLPVAGSKFDLRDRIMYALDNDGAVLALAKTPKPKSTFNWAKEELTLQTLITDNISFGPNFRNFMKKYIGKKFVCTSDFMDWVRSNEGKPLEDAIEQWKVLEARKEDPGFKRVIARHNMMSQYVRDFLADNAGKTFQNACHYWKKKKQHPSQGGYVRYERSDLELS